MDYRLEIQFFGGRGQTYKQALAAAGSGNGNYKENIDLPARMNRLFNGNQMSFEHTLDVFRDAHAFDTKQEHGILMDENGFVNFYVHGSAHSVFLTMRNEEVRGVKITQDKIAVHNHPNNSFYSRNDLLNFSISPVKSTIVVGRTQDYIVTKNSNFSKSNNKEKFYNYINRNNYADIYSFLKNESNQEKYGFTFSIRKH